MKQEGQVKIKQIAEPTAELERDKMMKDARGCTCKSTVLYRTRSEEHTSELQSP